MRANYAAVLASVSIACAAACNALWGIDGLSYGLAAGGAGTTSTSTAGSGGGQGGGGGEGGSGGSDAAGFGMVTGSSGDYGPVTTSWVTALFMPNTGPVTTCTWSIDGECEIMVCSVGTGGSGGAGGAGGAPAAPHAGTISVTGGQREVHLVPEADGTYPTDQSNTEALFSAGQTLTIAADGAEIPAFAEQLTAPSPIDVATPDFSGTVTIQTTNDLDVAWTGGAVGEVAVLLIGSDSDHAVTVTCTYDASAGSGTVPSSALEPLQGLANGSLSITTRERLTISPGDWNVSLGLSSIGYSDSSPTRMATGPTSFD